MRSSVWILSLIVGITPVLRKVRVNFRPPGGRFSSATLKTVRSLGLTVAFWTDDPADFNNPGRQVLETRFTRFLKSGGILLLHDNARQTAQILPDLVNDARTRACTWWPCATCLFVEGPPVEGTWKRAPCWLERRCHVRGLYPDSMLTVGFGAGRALNIPLWNSGVLTQSQPRSPILSA